MRVGSAIMLRFSRPDADVYVPAGDVAPEVALARTTHLCVIAHQDDIEINAYPAVAACYGRADKFFTGVVMTNGAGSARAGAFAHVTDTEMQEIRREEQRRAAQSGAVEPGDAPDRLERPFDPPATDRPQDEGQPAKRRQEQDVERLLQPVEREVSRKRPLADQHGEREMEQDQRGDADHGRAGRDASLLQALSPDGKRALTTKG